MVFTFHTTGQNSLARAWSRQFENFLKLCLLVTEFITVGLSSKLSGGVFCKLLSAVIQIISVLRWKFTICSAPSSPPKELNQFTPEDIDAIKAVLKQQQQDQDR
jgi:hypothetical protein